MSWEVAACLGRRPKRDDDGVRVEWQRLAQFNRPLSLVIGRGSHGLVAARRYLNLGQVRAVAAFAGAPNVLADFYCHGNVLLALSAVDGNAGNGDIRARD